MTEPFKNVFNSQMIALMANHFKKVWDEFDDAAFIAEATNNIENHELKQRSNQIQCAMVSCLPASFEQAATIILASLHPEDDVDLSDTKMDEKGIRGWAVLPMTQYVGEHSIDDFDLGMDVQQELTKRFSSEFGIRHLIIRDQDRALKTLREWANHKNYHVRRLVSEGTRPRLPWAMRLNELVKAPEPLFPILDLLKDDPSLYVRRSVANNLNDIAKDHPDKVATIAERWMKGASPDREKLVRHGLRSLIKLGHTRSLAALGYKKPDASLTKIDVLTPEVLFGSQLQFSISLKSNSSSDQNVILDYALHHCKTNGKTSAKVFKWKTFALKAGKSYVMERKHWIKKITTRKYYPGTHRVEILLNGESAGIFDFELVMPKD